jgi:hypothetical protein
MRVWKGSGCPTGVQIHEPLVGSGVWTSVVLPLISVAGLWPVFGIAVFFMAAWGVVYVAHFRPLWRRAAKAAADGDSSLLTVAGLAPSSDDAATAPLLQHSVNPDRHGHQA